MNWDSLEGFLLHDVIGNLAATLVVATAVALARAVRRRGTDGDSDQDARDSSSR